MAELTQAQQNLIQTYSTYGEQELYNLLGNRLTEYGSESVREVYVFGTPNILERGKKYLTDTGCSFAGTVCPLPRRLRSFARRTRTPCYPSVGHE
jgi:hypothetical protein